MRTKMGELTALWTVRLKKPMLPMVSLVQIILHFILLIVMEIMNKTNH